AVHAFQHLAAVAAGIAGVGVQELDRRDVVVRGLPALHYRPGAAAVGTAQDLAGIRADPAQRIIQEEYALEGAIAQLAGGAGGGETVGADHDPAALAYGDAALAVPHPQRHGLIEAVHDAALPIHPAVGGAQDGAHGLVHGEGRIAVQ